MRDMLRGCVRFAEETGRRAAGTALELLERGGVDLKGLERALTERVPAPVRSLWTVAEDVVTVGKGGAELVAGRIRSEAEKTWHRVGVVGDQVVKVGVILEFLERKLRELDDRGSGGSPEPSVWETTAPRADSLFGAGWEDDEAGEAPRAAAVPVRIPVVEESAPESAPDLAPEPQAVPEAVPEAESEPEAEPEREPGAAPESEETPAAKNTAVRTSDVTTPAVKATVVKATAVKTRAVRTTAAAKRTKSTKNSASSRASTEATAAKKAPARKAPVKKAPPAPGETGAGTEDGQ
jgi:hypothetical protein